MYEVHPEQFLGLRPVALEDAEAVVVPLPFERTVSYGMGTWKGPAAIIESSCQVETFDEETLFDFADRARVHTMPPVADDPELDIRGYLDLVAGTLTGIRDKFVLALGGEHTVTYGVLKGLVDDPGSLTVIQIDAHADLMDRLEGMKWNHGTVMRRLREWGADLIQIGVRSLSREEYDFAQADKGISMYFAHELDQSRPRLLAELGALTGRAYLSIDVDGFDPSVIPSTGTPQPNGLSWPRVMEIVRAVSGARGCDYFGADIVEFIPSPDPPGCDIVPARLAQKLLAYKLLGPGP